MKKINHLRVSPHKAMSPVKETTQEETVEDAELMSLKMVSPDGSFPKRALYEGSISPSTPTDNVSMRSFSEQRSSCMNFKLQYPI